MIRSSLSLWLALACGRAPLEEDASVERIEEEVSVEEPCLGRPPCEEPVTIEVDGVEVVYDHAEVTRRVRLAAMGDESAVSVAVRLLLGEVGPERLIRNRNAREEAVGVLATVWNRLDRERSDPEGRGARPWPGCEAGAEFAKCANSGQYRGLRTWRALHPAEHVDPQHLSAAVSQAVAAFWLLESGRLPDPTEGATSFAHRCGGRAYGAHARHCDGVGDDDLPGASLSTGPIAFRAPWRWDAERGLYRQRVTLLVDYEALPARTAER